MPQIKILIVDNDPEWRKIFKEALNENTGFIVSGIALTGKSALDKIKQCDAELIFFSDNVPDMDSLMFTTQCLEQNAKAGVVILSSKLDKNSTEKAVEAMEAGAFDVFVKPQNASDTWCKEVLTRNLIPKIRCLSIKYYSRIARNLRPEKKDKRDVSIPNEFKEKRWNQKYKAVLIGVSTGGPEALSRIVPRLPADFPLPVIIVLHIPKHFTQPMVQALNKKSSIGVEEARDGEVLQNGKVYLAPGGYHLTVLRQQGKILFKILDTPPVNGCKPSVDVLFESAVIFREKVIAVILTGMGCDGTNGLKSLKKFNIPTIVQDKDTSIVWGMPQSAAKEGLADEILPIDKIAGRIIKMVTNDTHN